MSEWAHAGGEEGRGRERDKQSPCWAWRLRPETRLDLKNWDHDLIWDRESGCFTTWATQAPLKWIFFFFSLQIMRLLSCIWCCLPFYSWNSPPWTLLLPEWSAKNATQIWLNLYRGSLSHSRVIPKLIDMPHKRSMFWPILSFLDFWPCGLILAFGCFHYKHVC